VKGEHVGEFEELVLLAVHGLRENAYGIAVQARLESETARSISIGAVYQALDRLERKGLLRSSLTGSTPEPGGRRRRAFELLPSGARLLEDLRRLRTRLYGARPLRSRGRA
jgi:PadR family transcriptional regulator PadR